MSSLTKLPSELITQIAENVYPGDAVNFACASRLLNSGIAGRLEEYGRIATRLHTLHDREPMRLFMLLQAFTRQPELGFFVHNFEVWAIRNAVEDWTWENLGFETPDWVSNDSSEDGQDEEGADDDDPIAEANAETDNEWEMRNGDGENEAHEDGLGTEVAQSEHESLSIGANRCLQGFFRDEYGLDELLGPVGDGIPHHEPRFDYSRVLREGNVLSEGAHQDVLDMIQKRLGFCSKKASHWMSKLMAGDDEPLKILLMSQSPRLRVVKFVNLRQEESALSPYRMFNKTIRLLALEYGTSKPWPCFQDIREVTTGSDYGKRYTLDEFYHPTWMEVASFLLLPNLETVTFDMVNHVESRTQAPPTYKWEWPGTKSTVKHLIFLGCKGDVETLDNLIGAISGLETISGFDWNVPKDDLICLLAQHQGTTLQYLDLISMRRLSVTANGLAALARFENLTQIDFAITDFIQESAFYESSPKEIIHGPPENANVQLMEILPESVKALKIANHLWRPNVAQCKDFISSLEKLVTAKGYGRFANLSHICLWGISVAMSHSPGMEEFGLDLAISGRMFRSVANKADCSPTI